MIKNKILKQAKKRLKQEMKEVKKRMKECAKKYPDWRDDEYNMLENKFIWGISKDTHPSFYTLNTIMIYFNRETCKYYLDFDFDAYEHIDDNYKTVQNLVGLAVALNRAYKAFTQYIIDNKIMAQMDVMCMKHWLTEPLGEAGSIAGLYKKFEFFATYYLQEIRSKLEQMSKQYKEELR